MHPRILTFVLAVSLLCAPLVAHAEELDAYARAIDANPDDDKAYEAFAAAAIQKKQNDEAIARLKTGIARLPSFPRGYYLMAVAYRQKEMWADAADYYRVYIALRPGETDAYFGLGKALEGMADKKGAATAFRKYATLEKRPEKQRFVDAATAEVAKLEGTGTPAQAPVPGAAPASGDAAALKAEAEKLKGENRFEEAAAAYQKAIAADGRNPDLYNDLGNVLFALKRYNDAAQAFRDATSRAPDGNYAIGWYNLANALRKAERKGEAVDAYKRYMALVPNDPDPWFGMAQTLKGLGDNPAAIKAYRKYLEMETRPEQAKWVERARAELAALEGVPKASAPGGKLGMDEKATIDSPYDRATTLDPFGPQPHDPNGVVDRPVVVDPFSPPRRDPDEIMPLGDEQQRRRNRDLRDPFDGDSASPHEVDDLMNPFNAPHSAPAPSTTPPTASRARDYGRAVAAFRRALAAQVEDVSVRYERGAQFAMQGEPRDAIGTWNTIPLDDGRVVKARESMSRFRTR